jgi:hypothetical protein
LLLLLRLLLSSAVATAIALAAFSAFAGLAAATVVADGAFAAAAAGVAAAVVATVVACDAAVEGRWTKSGPCKRNRKCHHCLTVWATLVAATTFRSAASAARVTAISVMISS